MLPGRLLSRWPALLLPLVVMMFLTAGQAYPTLADEGGFGKKIAGTYVGVQTDHALVLQIGSEGTLRFLFSIQFDASGADDLPFSNTWGSWKKTGKRQITARATNISFARGEGAFAGVSAATYAIEFSKRFQAATVTCEGAIFPPGVNPFLDQHAAPIPDGEFTCDFELHRISVDGKDVDNENDD